MLKLNWSNKTTLCLLTIHRSFLPFFSLSHGLFGDFSKFGSASTTENYYGRIILSCPFLPAYLLLALTCPVGSSQKRQRARLWNFQAIFLSHSSSFASQPARASLDLWSYLMITSCKSCIYTHACLGTKEKKDFDISSESSPARNDRVSEVDCWPGKNLGRTNLKDKSWLKEIAAFFRQKISILFSFQKLKIQWTKKS